mgnify:CR=1 FL=1
MPYSEWDIIVIRIGLLGSTGRMGQWVSKLLCTEFTEKAALVVQVDQAKSIDSLFSSDVVIDFSSAEGTQTLIQSALKHRGRLPCLVIGTTGWNSTKNEELDQLVKKTPILVAPNFSIAVFAFKKILEQFSPLLESLHYTPVMTDIHHIHKKDAPSGTALSLQLSMDALNPSRIPIHSVRAGEVIGEHSVTFYGKGDRISIEHQAQDRSIFARGAIEVAIWIARNHAEVQRLQRVIGIDFYFEKIKENHLCSNSRKD